jgi:hypothetical protein
MQLDPLSAGVEQSLAVLSQAPRTFDANLIGAWRLLCGKLLVPCATLPLQHPAGVFGRQRADLVKRSAVAARLPSSCSIRLAPTITLVTTG